jgi:hypothetical protein
VTDQPEPITSSQWNTLLLCVLDGLPFQHAVARGIPDTPRFREAFARLKPDVAAIREDGKMPEIPFD